MPKTTQLHSYHLDHAKMTEFAGYDMPLWYTTTSEEHMAVRNHSGVFDVSHMGRLEVEGPGAASFLEGLVPTQVQSQPLGKAFYTLLLNDKGGILDDLIIMRLDQDKFMVVVNAANAESDLRHLEAQLPKEGVELREMTSSTAMLAVQGPQAAQLLQQLTPTDLSQLKRSRCSETTVMGYDALVSRTGYTGEDGFELIIRSVTNDETASALQVWNKITESSLPCGLGARDSLRLEAGFPLHGSDIDAETDPYAADLGWVISADKTDYLGHEAIADLKSRPPSVLRRGVVLEQGIPRHGFEVLNETGPIGRVTSGTFSPVLHKGIALCRLAYSSSQPGSQVSVVVREAPHIGHTVKPPFYDEQVYGWKRQQPRQKR